jgi:very-short-patch-repair endonuclease
MPVERPPSVFPRALRRALTPAERRLWERLRGHQLDGFKFRRQHAIGRFIADFACLEAGLVIELDGFSHDVRVRTDQKRTDRLHELGWRVVRFTNRDVFQNPDGVIETILEALKRPPSPRPTPPSGRGSTQQA